MIREELREEADRLFHRALAAGLDAGRYLLVADPGNPDYETRILKGPYFGSMPTQTDKRLAWATAQIDKLIDHTGGTA